VLLFVTLLLIGLIGYYSLSGQQWNHAKSSMPARALPATLSSVELLISAWHLLINAHDPAYTSGLWGITSVELYHGEKVKFLYEQTAVAVSNGLQIKNICEVGVMAAGSSVFMIAIATEAHWWGFDLRDTAWGDRTEIATNLLEKLSPGRTTMTWGSSVRTLPAFAKSNPEVRCDLVLVDGSKNKLLRKADVLALRAISHANTLVFLDEVSSVACVSGTGPCEGLLYGEAGAAYAELVHQHLFTVDHCLEPFPVPEDSVCTGHFRYDV
jgi:hypothetical protein